MTTTTQQHQELVDLNRFLAEVATERRKALWTAIRDRETMGTPIPSEVSEGYDKANAMLHRNATALAMSSLVGTPVETVDGRLIVAYRSNEVDGSIRQDEAVLTEDGGIAKRAFWHSADEDGPITHNVRYEVYTAEGRVVHGYIDSRSRRITQSG